MSEAVTNALLHAGGAVALRLGVAEGMARFEVRDGSALLPVRRRHSQEAATGRGLMLIEALADRWGFDEAGDGGKVVWFELVVGPLVTPDGAGPSQASASFEAEAAPRGAGLRQRRHRPDGKGPPRTCRCRAPLVTGMAENDLVEVRLLGLPPSAYREASEHHEELRREFALIASQAESAYAGEVPSRLVTLGEELRRRFERFAAEPRVGLQNALASERDAIDLTYRVPPEVGPAAASFDALLDEADAFCRRGGALLTLATPPRAAAFRRWFLGEFVRQANREARSGGTSPAREPRCRRREPFELHAPRVTQAQASEARAGAAALGLEKGDVSSTFRREA